MKYKFDIILGIICPISDSKEIWAPPPPKQNFGGGGNQQNQSNSGKDSGDGSGKEERGRKRAKKSRWGSMIRTEIPGMPAAIPTHLTPEQQKAYISEYNYDISLFKLFFQLNKLQLICHALNQVGIYRGLKR